MENIKSVILSSDDFLNKAFNPCEIEDGYRSNVVSELNNFLIQYDYKELGGGKSGATIYLLSNKSEQCILKFSEDAIITSTKEGNSCTKNQKSINELKDEKAKTSCTRSMFGSLMKCKKDLSNITIYDSDLHYIRAIREIYLMKKYSELQHNSNNSITPNIFSLGFIGNHVIEKQDMEIYVLEFSISYKKLSNDSSSYAWVNIQNENRQRSSSLTIKLKENNIKNNKSFEMVIGKVDDIDNLILNQEGLLRNNRITKKLSESNKIKEITDLFNKHRDEFISLVKDKLVVRKVKRLQLISNSDSSNGPNKHMPFVIQEKVEGKELLYYEDRGRIPENNESKSKYEVLTDEIRLKILISLGKSLLTFKTLLQKNEKGIGCHRDMHPRNIFIIKDENNNISVKFIDFDLSITNTNELSSNTKCKRSTLAKFSFGTLGRKAGFTIGPTIKYLGPFLYESVFIGSPDFLYKDDDMFQYLMYIKKFWYNMDNQQLKNELFNKLTDLIKDTKTKFQYTAILYNSDVIKYERLNNQKFYFLEEFIKIIEDLLNKKIQKIYSEINTELKKLNILYNLKKLDNNNSLHVKQLTKNNSLPVKQLNKTKINKIKKNVKSNAKLMSNLLKTSENNKATRIQMIHKKIANFMP